MTLDLSKGMPVFKCDGTDCPHLFRGFSFNVKKSVEGLKEAGWTVTVKDAAFVHYCGQHTLMLKEGRA